MKTRKTFDCVEMKRRGAERIHGLTAGMTVEEQQAFWEKRTRLLEKAQLAVRMKHKTSAN